MLTDLPIPVWQDRRERFNHYWLQNVFLEAVSNAIARLDQVMPDWDSAALAIDDQIAEWIPRREALDALVQSFEGEMSPAVLFKPPPLSRETTFTIKWMTPLVHSLWKQRNGIREKLQSVQESISRADAIYKRLETEWKSKRRDAGRVVDLLQELETACLALASAIHTLPDRVLVT